MTSKFEGQDPSSAATNHNRRHSGGQGHKSKLVPVDGEPRKTKDEQQHQHGLTNGHASREERRGSSDGHGKPQSDNKENAQGQNGKEDNPEKKKKRKRKKKKGAGGGGNAGTGGGNANGNGECVREAVESESRLAGTDGALKRGRLTHTSSEEHSDEPGSTHADVNGLEIHPIPQVQSDTSSPQPASASESLGREAIDNQIDLGQKIDTESTNITVSSSGTIQACDVECTLQTSGGSVNNARASGEGFALDRSALVEQHDMSHGAEGHSKSLDLSCENEGSSVDAELKDAEDFEENDLFIQEDSDLSGKVSGSGTCSGTECSSDTSTSEQLPSGEDILGKDVTDQPNGLLHIEQPVPDMREDKDTSSAEKPGKHNSEQNELGNETGEGNSQLEDSGSLPREHGYVQDIPPASTQGGDGNEQDEIIHNSGPDFPKNVPGSDTSDQAALENCTRSHLDIEYSVSENNEDPESCSSPEENGDIRLEKDKEHDGGCAPRSKREISVVDLIGARSTAGSAIRAGIIQDMMLTSGSSGQPAGTGSSMSKTDFTGCVDVAGDGESEPHLHRSCDRFTDTSS
ncbi:hypothetical protein RRG08_027968 [Elysia crispata]|uniref:Uncharacterized protein n=1 Tax=Elysia crispata TaxID=231223 RepID=A0AAE0ZJR6_9GAST|nr:hypothetical protein RRG08_027968 [Elysia crispata]